MKKTNIAVELNWWIKAFLYLCIYLVIKRYITGHTNISAALGGSFVCLLLASLSFKCTSTGYCRGLNFYLFSVYSKKYQFWEKFNHLSIDNLWWTYSISLGYGSYGILRCVFSNFDELAELISRNTVIKEDIRQQFVNYIDNRKREGIISRIFLRPTVFFLILLGVKGIFYIIDKK
ncbi:MAG: hypothetical protein FWB85_05220 [Chitinispirillia bacterium]|nr:hypothetical protein [Chitinispirillia bacterium]